jgi:hypothetical protein
MIVGVEISVYHFKAQNPSSCTLCDQISSRLTIFVFWVTLNFQPILYVNHICISVVFKGIYTNKHIFCSGCIQKLLMTSCVLVMYGFTKTKFLDDCCQFYSLFRLPLH